MHTSSRRLTTLARALASASLVASAACAADNPGQPAPGPAPDAAVIEQDGNQAADATGSVTDTGPDKDTVTAPDTATGPDVATGADTATGPDAAAGPDAGRPGEPVPSLRLTLSAALLEVADDGGKLTITCAYVDKNKQPLADPGDLLTAVSGQGAVKKDGAWTFSKPGAREASCASAKLGLTAKASFVVADATVDTALSRAAGGLGKSAALVGEILAANAAKDVGKLAAAVAEFTKVGVDLTVGFVTTDSVLLAKGAKLPSVAACEKGGLKPAADDVAWAASLDGVQAALDQMQAAIDAVNPAKADVVDLAALTKASGQLEAALATMAALQPSPLQVRISLAKLDALVTGKLVALMDAHHGLIGELVAKPPPPPPSCQGCWTLAGLTVSIGIQYILSSVPSYTGLLKDVAWQAGHMAATLVLAGILDKAFPPDAGGPIINGLQVGYNNVVHQGTTIVLWGDNWDLDGGCSAVLITPVVTGALLNGVKAAIDGIPNFKDLNGKDVWKAAKAVKGTIDGVQSVIKFASGDMPDVASKGVLTHGSSVTDTGIKGMQSVTLGAIPTGINSGMLPQPALLYPICPTTGRGEVFKLLIYPKK